MSESVISREISVACRDLLRFSNTEEVRYINAYMSP